MSLPKNAHICENPFINIFGCLVFVLNKKNIKNKNFHISSIFNAPFCLCHVRDKIYPIIDINMLTVYTVFFFLLDFFVFSYFRYLTFWICTNKSYLRQFFFWFYPFLNCPFCCNSPLGYIIWGPQWKSVPRDCLGYNPWVSI